MLKVGDSLTKFVIRDPPSPLATAAEVRNFSPAPPDGPPNKWIS